MTWQIAYALKNIAEGWQSSRANYIGGDYIMIATDGRPDVLAAISANRAMSLEDVQAYHSEKPELDFLCGYQTVCIWDGAAIDFSQANGFGWGSFGTLGSAILDGNVHTAQHKTFAFSDRLIRQFGKVKTLEREFDRVYKIELWGEKTFRVAMLADYEPTADGVRTTWENFGPVDVIWNINPNGKPTRSALQAGADLGCKVVKWDDFKDFMKAL